MKLAALAFPVLLLAAPAIAKPEVYHAAGTEPFWSLDIGSRSIVFSDEGNGVRIVTGTPAARPSFNGRRYVTKRITVDITRKACNDGMSDSRYADTVTVRIGRRTYIGCGNLIIDSAFLDGGWVVVSVGGRPINEPPFPTLRFDGPRVAGSTGCNSFNGGYRIDRGALSAGRLVTTRRACLGGAMQTESTFLKILTGPARLSVEDGRITLTATAGSIRLRRAD